MTADALDADLHPFDLHARRDPLAGAAVDVVVIGDDPGRAAEFGRGLVLLLGDLGRSASLGDLKASSSPLVLVAPAVDGWTAAHLAPLLKAINHADHVVGRRPSARRLAVLPWRLLFAVTVADIHSPCRLHRREALAAIPIQSTSDFADVERLAKATFLGHLVDEVDVPELASPRRKTGRRRDLATVFRHPTFVHPSDPAEDPQGDGEGADGPGPQDGQGDDDPAVGEPGPLQ